MDVITHSSALLIVVTWFYVEWRGHDLWGGHMHGGPTEAGNCSHPPPMAHRDMWVCCIWWVAGQCSARVVCQTIYNITLGARIFYYIFLKKFMTASLVELLPYAWPAYMIC